MRYASIDIGTNTLRLLVAETGMAAPPRPIIYRRAITRLGGGYTVDAGIDRASAERTFKALAEFCRAIDETGGLDEVIAAATSVVRRAANGKWFLGEVLRRTGLMVRVLSGDEEARISMLGVASVIRDASPRRLVMDIGGGSTEFIAIEDDAIAGTWSMEMGVVHLTEGHLMTDPPSPDELSCLEGEISGVLDDLKGRMKGDGVDPSAYGGRATLVGTAGTVTTLAALDQGIEVYDRERVNNYRLTREAVARIYSDLARLTLDERSVLLALEKGREDLIIPGAAIMLLVMDSFGFGSVRVSDAGLLEGLIIERAGSHEGMGREGRHVPGEGIR
jgi:exopolyphosphatase/guanosine-5'-triphosphate,3'-diphosphate pyrophosphatase